MDIQTQIDNCTVSTARRIATMLNLDHDSIHNGGVLPRGWHFPLLAGDTPRERFASLIHREPKP
jgi:3-methylfumaryl-CoA hydratase